MRTNDEQLHGDDAPQLRAYWGDEQEIMDRRHLSDSMRHAQRVWARVEVYWATRRRGGRLPTLIAG
jgi:hypothetical protein